MSTEGCDASNRFACACASSAAARGDAELLLVGEISMTGAKDLCGLGIIRGTRIGAFDDDGNRSAERKAAFDSRQYPAAIVLGARGGVFVLRRLAAIEGSLDDVFTERQSGRTTVHDTSHGWSVRLAESTDPENNPSLTCHCPLASPILRF